MSNKKKNIEESLEELFRLKVKISSDVDLARDLLNEIEREKRIKRVIMLTSVAAVFLLALWVTGPLLTKFDSNQLYSEYYSKLEADINLRTPRPGDSLKLAIMHYNSGNASEAIESLGKIMVIDDQKGLVSLYTALSLIELSNYQSAKPILEGMLEDGKLVQPEAYWYLALISLKNGKLEAARSNLKGLKKIDKKYRPKDVRKILRKIRFRENA